MTIRSESLTLFLSPVAWTAGSHKATGLDKEWTSRMVWEMALVRSADPEEAGAQEGEMEKRDPSPGSRSYW